VRDAGWNRAVAGLVVFIQPCNSVIGTAGPVSTSSKIVGHVDICLHECKSSFSKEREECAHRSPIWSVASTLMFSGDSLRQNTSVTGEEDMNDLGEIAEKRLKGWLSNPTLKEKTDIAALYRKAFHVIFTWRCALYYAAEY
jgi:hypothetical protein